MTIDHIGYAVKKIDAAIRSFEDLGYQFEPIISDTDRNIKIAFGEKDGYRIELVTPLDKTMPSPVDIYLSKIGPTPYHICYQSEDLESDIEQLRKLKYIVINEPKPAIAFNNKRVAFLMCIGFGLIEIVDKE